MGRRGTAGILIGVTLLGLLLRIVYFQGFVGKDDLTYIDDGYRLARGDYLPRPNEWDVRIGIIAPLALAIRVFGLHDWSVALYPLCLSLLSLPLIYTLGKTLYSERVGLIAALLLACFPQDIHYATVAYSVLPSVFYASLAILLAYRSRRPRTRRARLRLAAGAGLAMAVSYLTYEGQAVFAAICLLAIWSDRARDKPWRLLLVAAVPLCAVVVEGLIYWRLTGDPLFRFVALHTHSDLMRGTGLAPYALQWLVALLNPGYPQTFFYGMLTLWAVLMMRGRPLRAEDRLLATWLLGGFVFFAFAVISLRPLIPLLQVEPYILHGLAYPAILLVARALYETYPVAKTRRSAGT